MTRPILVATLLLALPASALAQSPPKADRAAVEAIVKSMFSRAPAEWQKRAEQDETQRICSETRNSPSNADFEKIKAREATTIVYPPDGNVIGDWKNGARIAQNGRGHQFSDAPGTVAGGNCYACHQISKAEVSYGTLGPSLTEYGKIRKFGAEESKQAYAKIYNSHSVTPCSNMPRFGANKFLTIEQIKDVTAYLMSPDSPVNK
jgi:sulfur-oxidizing protein SoxX